MLPLTHRGLPDGHHRGGRIRAGFHLRSNDRLRALTDLEQAEKQDLSDPIRCSLKEKEYLIYGYNHYFSNSIKKSDIIDDYAGLRPLIRSKNNFSKSSREYAIQKNHKLISVYGGKWTTSRALAKNVCNTINF